MKVTFLKADQTEDTFNWVPETLLDGMSSLPLAEELEKADQLKQCSPTVSLIKKDDTDILWGSIISCEESSFKFIAGRIEGTNRYDIGEISFERFLDLSMVYIEGKEFNEGRLLPKRKGLLARLLGF